MIRIVPITEFGRMMWIQVRECVRCRKQFVPNPKTECRVCEVCRCS